MGWTRTSWITALAYPDSQSRRIEHPLLADAFKEVDFDGARVDAAVGAPASQTLAAENALTQLRFGGSRHEILELLRYVPSALAQTGLAISATRWHVK